MSTASTIAWDDTVLPFQLDRSDIRGRVARLDGVLDQVLSQHDYPPAVEALVAEMALLTALIGQTIKLRWKLSLQVRGDGPARLIATDYYGPTADGQPGRIRAYASYDQDAIDPTGDPFSQVGKGYFAVAQQIKFIDDFLRRNFFAFTHFQRTGKDLRWHLPLVSRECVFDLCVEVKRIRPKHDQAN